MTRLWTLEKAAQELDVPLGSLRSAAERHGFLVRMGRSLRIDPDTLEEFVEQCREEPQEQDYTSAPKERARATGSSVMAEDPCQRALATADRLSKSSPSTSRKRTDRPPAPVVPIK